MNLYRDYSAAFIAPIMKLDHQDYRVYVPSGEQCIENLREFVAREYKVKQVEDFVKVDACLGYIFTSEYLDEDKEQFPHIANHLQTYTENEELQRIFKATKVDDFSENSKECVGNLLHRAIRARDQFKGVQCNNHWLLIFNAFAECQKEIFDQRESDAYLRIIYEVVVRRAHECFDHEVKLINEAADKYYLVWKNMIKNSIAKKFGNKLRGMAAQRRWPDPIFKLLAFVQNNDEQVSLRVVAGLVKGINDERFPGFRETFLKNLSEGATKKLAPKKGSKSSLHNDPDQSVMYRNLIDGMCQFFRKSDNERNYDFSTPIVRMVRMVSYEPVFGISVDYLVDKILRHATSSAAIYLAGSACNVMAFTEARLVTNIANAAPRYEVTFVPDTSEMVLWPDAGYY